MGRLTGGKVGRSIGPSTFFFSFFCSPTPDELVQCNLYSILCAPYSVHAVQTTTTSHVCTTYAYGYRSRRLWVCWNRPPKHPSLLCVCCHCTAAYGNIASTFLPFFHISNTCPSHFRFSQAIIRCLPPRSTLHTPPSLVSMYPTKETQEVGG